MVSGPMGELVEGLVEMAGVAARADGDERQQPRIAGRVGACGGGHEAAHLRQGVVEDVGQAVPVFDQVLDGVEPTAAFTTGGSFAAATAREDAARDARLLSLIAIGARGDSRHLDQTLDRLQNHAHLGSHR